MSLRTTALPAGAAIMLLAACNTTDPFQGGFLGGIGGLTSGNYEQGVKDREQKLENTQDEQVSLQREVDRANQRNAALEAEITATQAELDRLDQDLRVLRNKIDQAEMTSNANRAELDVLQNELNDIDAEVDAQSLNFDEKEKKAQLAELKRRKKRLEEALLILLE